MKTNRVRGLKNKGMCSMCPHMKKVTEKNLVGKEKTIKICTHYQNEAARVAWNCYRRK